MERAQSANEQLIFTFDGENNVGSTLSFIVFAMFVYDGI